MLAKNTQKYTTGLLQIKPQYTCDVRSKDITSGSPLLEDQISLILQAMVNATSSLDVKFRNPDKCLSFTRIPSYKNTQ